jgi:hypothetical protein
MVRLWRGTMPYVTRVQSEKLLCSVTDKAFRLSIASSSEDDSFITCISGDYDVKVRIAHCPRCHK